jgi:hypothetical protein
MAKMSRKGVSVLLPALALLALGGLSFRQIANNAPAFSVDLRIESVFGDWRLPQSEALYDWSEYRFQLGYGYLQGDTAALLSGDDALPELAALEANAERAEELFRTSLTGAPGRASAWTSLGWAHLLQGRPDAAEAALRISWELAPFNVAEAPERLAIAEALDALSGEGWRSSDATALAIEADRATLETYDPRFYELLFGDIPVQE